MGRAVSGERCARCDALDVVTIVGEGAYCFRHASDAARALVEQWLDATTARAQLGDAIALPRLTLDAKGFPVDRIGR